MKLCRAQKWVEWTLGRDPFGIRLPTVRSWSRVSEAVSSSRRQVLLQRPAGDQQAGLFELTAGEGRAVAGFMVAEHRVVIAFDVEVGVVPGADQGVNDFRPVGLAESGKAMFRHARVADAVGITHGRV